MSTRYRKQEDVPTFVLCDRLKELSQAVAKGRDAVSREFTMRIPAELDRDADLVLSEAARRLRKHGEGIADALEGDTDGR